MFIEASLAIAKKWNWSKCLSTGKWLSKLWHSSTMECTIDNPDGLSATIQMDLQGILLHENEQS